MFSNTDGSEPEAERFGRNVPGQGGSEQPRSPETRGVAAPSVPSPPGTPTEMPNSPGPGVVQIHNSRSHAIAVKY